MTNWFDVDREGLRRLMAGRPKSFVLFELLQNAWDEETSLVSVRLEPAEGRGLAHVVVEDDSPDGFRQLSHAYTMFAESCKKSDPEKRGRFNLGEKMVLALCETAQIQSTTGTVIFDGAGRRTMRKRRARGTVFEATLRMTRAEYEEVCLAARRVIPPAGVRTVFNGGEIAARPLLHSFSASLPTLVADGGGVLKRVVRKTEVRLYDPLAEEEGGGVFEMGLPVVPTGDRYAVSVGQKVPVNLDRDNLPPSYLRALRTLVLNATYASIGEEDATAPWVREALADPRVEDEAVRRAMRLRFGERAVIADPSDREGTKLAMSSGYEVVSGGALAPGEWQNVKRSGALLPAGQVTPSPKPFAPGGKPLRMLDEADYTPGVRLFVEYAREVGCFLLGCPVEVVVAADGGWPFDGAYGSRRLIVNAARLGMAWFDQGATVAVNDFLLHEWGHAHGQHLDKSYHEAITRFGARLVALALERPEFFRKYIVEGAASVAAKSLA